MLKISAIALGLCFLVLPFQSVSAKEIPVQARFFMGMTGVNSEELNTFTAAQGLKKLEGVSQLGLEITYPIHKYLDVGARYTKKMADAAEEPDNPATDYSVRLDQDAFLLIARVPFIKTDFYRVDAFGGVGGTNTKLTLKTAGQNGELSKSVGDNWYASPYAAAGVSLSLGYKRFYLVFEGAYEMNKVKDFSRSGSVGSNISELDLSGSYFTLGLLLDGIPGTVGK